MKYEKPQKGNPHNLVINQHILPNKSIESYVNQNGFVEVFFKNKAKKLSIRPNNKLFCAQRIWDHRTEVGFMKDIEDKFHELSSKIISNPTITLGDQEHIFVSRFYVLWDLRFRRSLEPIGDVELKGIHPGEILSKDHEEILEKKGLILVKNLDNKAIVPSRFNTGMNIQMAIDSFICSYKDLKWGIVISTDGEFLVPDNYGRTTIVPVSPNVILLGNSKNIYIAKSETKKVNRLAKLTSQKIFFARNISNCPT
ncbi:MAG: hypothetical protein OEY01_12205 [Desulfobulbaceae bacterium]|nr:hypothetical protein [Desulfobulbaceae bacterium]